MKLTPEEKQDLLKAQGFNMVDMGMMKMSISRNKALDALMDRIEADPTVSKEAQGQIIVALANKWKANRDVYSQIDSELRNNPELGVRIQVVASANPTSLVAAIGQYTPGNMGTALPAKGSYPEAEKRYGSSAAAQASPVAVVAAVSQPSAPAPASPQGQSDDEDAIWEAAANAADDDIKKLATADNIRQFADQIAKLAITKHGINPATANAFASTIKRDPKLAQDIATNLQNNPEFVRQLARMAKDSKPLPEPARSAAKSEMNKLMENPQFLADAKYVQGMQQKIQLAEQLKNEGIGGIFKSMFAQFGGGASNMSRVFDQFTGRRQVFIMGSGNLFSGGFLRVNLEAMASNAAEAYAASTTSANALRTFPELYKTVAVTEPDGKPKLDKDGKPVTEQVANTFELEGNGKKMKVILALGLTSNELKGRINPETNQFEPSDRVAFWGITEIGSQPKLIYTSKKEFLAFKEAVDMASAKYGDGSKLHFTDYTEKDAREAARDAERRLAGIQVANVDPKTGVVTQTVAGLTVQSGQVRKPNGVTPGQEPDYELRG